jgi:hypothetical protein
MNVMGGKITINLKTCTTIEKEETRAHRKRSRSIVSREGCLSCDSDGPKAKNAWSDSTRIAKVNHHKANHHKMRPYYAFNYQTEYCRVGWMASSVSMQ